MKTATLLVLLFSLGAMAQAQQSPFNGIFCGDGEVIIQGQTHKGTKIVEVTVTDAELRLKRDHTDFDDGSYMDGRPEYATISAGKIIYNGAVVGTISSSALQTETIIAGYDIKYAIKSVDSDSISYTRSSVSGTWRMDEEFPVLKRCPFKTAIYP